MEVATDFLVVPTRQATAEELKAHPPLGADGKSFEISDFVAVERLGSEVANRLMDECTPGNLGATRQYGERYSFVRRDAPLVQPYDWDQDHEITLTVALSRLVRPNAYSTQYAVRKVDYGSTEKFIPLHGEGSFYGYMVNPGHRDWLDAADGEELRELCGCYHSGSTDWGARERRAFRLCEESARKPYLDDAAMAMVTGLEALLHTKRKHSTRQFVERTVQLADQLGVAEYTREVAKAIYDFRSAAAHGSGPEGADDEQLPLRVRATQRLLRVTVSKLVREPAFGEIFRSVARIRVEFPI